MTPRLDPLLGLHFGNVLGDALRAERGLARRLSRVARRSSRYRVRPELVLQTVRLFRSYRPFKGWVEAMTSLGRLIFFDQPGTGASDPVTPDALPTLEQWADSITAVLDDLGRAKRFSSRGRRVRDSGAVRGDTSVSHHRAGRARRLRDAGGTPLVQDETKLRLSACGAAEDPTSGKPGHAVERGDPGNVGPNGTSGG